MPTLNVNLPRLAVLVAAVSVMFLWPSDARVAYADSHSLVFNPSVITLDEVNDVLSISIEVSDIGSDNADTVQINIVHDDSVVSISNPQCAGIYFGGSVTSPQRVDGDTATAFACTLSDGPSADSGAVMTFDVERLALGEPTLSFGTTGPFRTTFIEAGTPVPNGSLGSLQVLENHAPVADSQVVGTNEDTGVAVTMTATDDNGDPLTFAVATGPANGVLTGTSPNVTYTPNTDFNGADSFTYTATDDELAESAPATVTLNVAAVNDPPSFTGDGDQTVLEDAGAQSFGAWATGMSPGPADESTQVLTFVVTNDNNGLFSVQPSISETTGNLTFTPAADANGSATVTAELQDDGGTTNGGQDTSTPHVFTITVTPVNDAPSFTPGGNQLVLEDSGSQTAPGWAVAILAGPPNESGQVLSFAVTNDNNALFSVQPAVSPTGTLSFTLAADANGVANVDVQLQDDGGTANGGVATSSTESLVITVTVVNDAPVFTKGGDETVLENSGAHTVGGWATGITAGPADESGQSLNFLVTNDNNSLFTSQPAISSTGQLTYQLAPETNGVANVSVQLQDDGGTLNGGSDTSPVQAFTITVDPVFDVTGSITLQGASLSDVIVNVTLIHEGGPVFNNVVVASDGSFTVANAPVGNYVIQASADGYQAAERSVLAISASDVAMPAIELRGGLVNGDGVVDGADVSLVIANFGSASADRTDGLGNWVDMNGDGFVNGFDISITLSNLLLSGDQAW